MANIATYAKKAKRIRSQHPSMSWQNAMKAAARGGVSGTAAVGRTRKRRRVSGTAAVGSTRKRRRRVGSTGGNLIKEIVPMAVGMAGGVAAQHFLLRPLESKIAERFPMAAKFMAVGEIVLGGFVAMKGKSAIIKGIGLGIMAGGVQTGVKQLNIYHESPAVQGIGDYTTVQIPVSGEIREMLSGIVDKSGTTRTSLVANSNHRHWDGGIDNRWQDERIQRTNLLAGLYGLDDSMGDIEDQNYLLPKGVF